MMQLSISLANHDDKVVCSISKNLSNFHKNHFKKNDLLAINVINKWKT